MARKGSKVVTITNRSQEVLEDIIRETAITIEVGMEDIVTDAKRNAPAASGDMASKIQSGIKVTRRTIAGMIWAKSPAAHVEFGTGLWGPKKDYIYPKEKKVLMWRDGKTGAKIFATKVKGQPPQPFMKPALDKGIPKMVKNLKKIRDRIK